MANTAFITSSAPGKDGVLFVAPVGVNMPTSAKDTLDDQFKDMGILRDNGVKQTINRDKENVKGYGGGDIYTLQKEFSESFSMTVTESANPITLKGIFGEDNVVVTDDGITIKHNKAKLPRCSVVIDHLIDQGIKRQVIEVAQITLAGDVQHTHEDIIQYDIEIDTYEGKDGNNVLEYLGYVKDGKTVQDLQIATSVLSPGKVSAEYSAKVIATDGAQPYTFKVTEGELPEGLQLATDGTISGNPTAQGEKSFTVTVTDSQKATATKRLTLSIAE